MIIVSVLLFFVDWCLCVGRRRLMYRVRGPVSDNNATRQKGFLIFGVIYFFMFNYVRTERLAKKNCYTFESII